MISLGQQINPIPEGFLCSHFITISSGWLIPPSCRYASDPRGLFTYVIDASTIFHPTFVYNQVILNDK